MCDVGYLCANFGLPEPLCSRLRPDVRDRQADDKKEVRQAHVRQHHRLMPPSIRGGHNNYELSQMNADVLFNGVLRHEIAGLLQQESYYNSVVINSDPQLTQRNNYGMNSHIWSISYFCICYFGI